MSCSLALLLSSMAVRLVLAMMAWMRSVIKAMVPLTEARLRGRW